MSKIKATPIEDWLRKNNRLGKYRIHNISKLSTRGERVYFNVHFLSLKDEPKAVWQTIDGVDLYQGERFGSFHATLNAGSLPCVAYNLVFENGRQRGDFSLKRPTRFTVDLTSQSFISGSIVPESAFGPPFQIRDAELLKLRARDSIGPLDLYIPCFEVFRAYYATSSKIVQRMFSGNWERARDEIVNVSKCHKVTANEWQIVLRSRIREDEEHAQSGGLLAWDAFGVSCVKDMEAALPSGKIRCIVPSQKMSLDLAGEALLLPADPHTNSRRALLFRILKSKSPLPDDLTIGYIKETGGEGETVVPAGPDEQAPYSGYPEIIVAANEVESMESANPVSGMESVTSEALSLQWDSSIVFKKLPKKQSIRYERGETVGKREVDTSSTAMIGGTPATSLQENVTAERRGGDQGKCGEPVFRYDALPEQFSELLSAFEELGKEIKGIKGQIDSFRVLTTNRPDDGVSYGSHVVWAIPTKHRAPSGIEHVIRWGWADVNKQQPRGVLVVEIYLKNFVRPVYWIELLKGTSSGYRSLILATPKSIYEVMDAIIRHWTHNEPTVPHGSRSWMFPENSVGTTWRHCYTPGRLRSIMERLLEVANM